MIGTCEKQTELQFGDVETETWYLEVRALAYAVDKSILDSTPDRPIALENAMILSEMLMTKFPEYQA